MNEWTYLSDGLYAKFDDGWHITLRANDPQDADSPTVYLDFTAYRNLVRFAEREDVFDCGFDSYR